MPTEPPRFRSDCDFLQRSTSFLPPAGGSVPAAGAERRSCAGARAAGTPRAWRGTTCRAACCRSSGGWPAACPGRWRTARSRRLSPPRTAPAPGSPWRGLWRGGGRARCVPSRSCPPHAGIPGGRRARWGWTRSRPGCRTPAATAQCQAWWRTPACKHSWSRRPSCSPQIASWTIGGSGTCREWGQGEGEILRGGFLVGPSTETQCQPIVVESELNWHQSISHSLWLMSHAHVVEGSCWWTIAGFRDRSGCICCLVCCAAVCHDVQFKRLPFRNQRVKYLFSMMLGLAVTRCVLVPTSFTYSFESGGRLHLNGGGAQQGHTHGAGFLNIVETACDLMNSHECYWVCEPSVTLDEHIQETLCSCSVMQPWDAWAMWYLSFSHI